MKQLDYLKKQMKYLTDKNLSLNAKGLLSIILLKDEISLEEIKELCSNDMKSINRASVELLIARYIKYRSEAITDAERIFFTNLLLYASIASKRYTML